MVAMRLIRDEDPLDYDNQTQTARNGFAMIPAEVFAMNDMAALSVFAVIAKHANKQGECWPSVQTICAALGVSKKVVQPAIDRLIEAGIITKERRFERGMKQSNAYQIVSYGRMVPTGPTLVPTEPLDGSHGSIGWHPQNHKQEPVELEPREVTIGASSEKSPKRKPETDAPDELPLREQDYEWATSKGFEKDQADRELEAMLNWHRAKGNRFRDWYMAWRTWMGRAKPEVKPDQLNGMPPEIKALQWNNATRMKWEHDHRGGA